MSLHSFARPRGLSGHFQPRRGTNRRSRDLCPVVLPLEERQLLSGTTGTLISISASAVSLTYGQADVFTATVDTNPPSTLPVTGGMVTFSSGGKTLGIANLVNGLASITAVPGAGNYTVTATFSGYGSFAASSTTTSVGYIFAAAGTGTYGTNTNDVPATSSDLANPFGVAVDTAGNIYIADTFNQVIEEVSATTGLVTTIAGISGVSGLPTNGPALSSKLFDPRGLAFDASLDALFIADRDNNMVEELSLGTSPPTITVVAGNGTYGSSGMGGPATSAELGSPTAVAVNPSTGILYITDTFNNRIDAVNLSTGIITTVVGSSSSATPGSVYGFAGDGGPATSAELANPQGIAVDSAGDLFIADSDNDVIREVSASTGNITTIAGTPQTSGYTGDGGPATSATLFTPWGLAINNTTNQLYIADRDNNAIRVVNLNTGTIGTLAGTGTFGSTGNGGAATAATLSSPRSVAVGVTGAVYIADTLGNEIRMVAGGQSSTSLTVKPAPLTVTVAPVSRLYGAPNGTFTILYSGFVNGDTAASLTSSGTATTTANTASVVGNYPITVSGTSSPNYTVTYVPGNLTVVSLVALPPGGTSVISPIRVNGRKKQAIVLHVSDLANATATANLANYSLIYSPSAKGARSRVIRIRSLSFNASTGILYLFPAQRLVPKMRYKLTIYGQPGSPDIYYITKGGLSSNQPN